MLSSLKSQEAQKEWIHGRKKTFLWPSVLLPNTNINPLLKLRNIQLATSYRVITTKPRSLRIHPKKYTVSWKNWTPNATINPSTFSILNFWSSTCGVGSGRSARAGSQRSRLYDNEAREVRSNTRRRASLTRSMGMWSVRGEAFKSSDHATCYE